RIAAVIQLLLIGSVLGWFGRVVVRNLSASIGTITKEAVVVQPARLYGIRFPGPAGRFPLGQFRAVQVERIFGPLGTAQHPAGTNACRSWARRAGRTSWSLGRTPMPASRLGRGRAPCSSARTQ